MAGSEQDAISDEEAGPIRLLLVEDDPEDVSSIQRLLAEVQDTLLMAGHAQGLEEALQKLQHGSYDVVLMDLSLPEGLGLDALSRARVAAATIPIVAMTHVDEGDQGVRALRVGAQDYLVKGQFNTHHLVRTIRHAVERHRMVSELRRAREREHYLASHDNLTGLLNRSSFNEDLRRAVAQAKRQDRLMAVLFLDLDNFKTINDTLGHSVGDQLLVQLAERLKHVTRESDILARIGGDEFIVGITNITKEHHAGIVAHEILTALENPFMLEGCEYRLTTSIGVTVYPQDGTDADVLLRNADTAMYYAKNQGRDRYQFFTEEMNARAVTRLDLENRLRQVVARDELLLHYQPMVDVAAGGIIAAEALVRWQHPVRGLLSSDEFIPVAEEIGVIGILGEWVLRKACQDAVEWPQVRGEPIRLAVNVSCRQLGRADFADRVMEILEETGFPANRLDLEITESSLVKDQGIAMETLTVLRNRGVRIALDDFGIEYSSLRALKTMPVNTLKIDRCFVAGVVSDPRDATIVTATITMARGLGLELVAEGVETAEQVEFLYGLGCFRMQGYLFAKPAPLAEVVKHFTDPCADWQQTLESLGV